MLITSKRPLCGAFMWNKTEIKHFYFSFIWDARTSETKQKLDGLQCFWDTLQYRFKDSVLHRRTRQVTTVYLFTDAQAVYFLHSKIPSVTCLRLSNASVICHVTYFQFPILLSSLLFFHVGSQAAAVACVIYPISDIGRCRNMGSTFLVWRVQPRGMTLNWF